MCMHKKTNLAFPVEKFYYMYFRLKVKQKIHFGQFSTLFPKGLFLSPTRPSGPSWSSSCKVCLSVCLMSPFHVIFLRPLIGPQVT